MLTLMRLVPIDQTKLSNQPALYLRRRDINSGSGCTYGADEDYSSFFPKFLRQLAVHLL